MKKIIFFILMAIIPVSTYTSYLVVHNKTNQGIYIDLLGYLTIDAPFGKKQTVYVPPKQTLSPEHYSPAWGWTRIKAIRFNAKGKKPFTLNKKFSAVKGKLDLTIERWGKVSGTWQPGKKKDAEKFSYPAK